MDLAKDVLTAIGILGPVIEDLTRYIRGEKEEPSYLAALPTELRSRVALERLQRRVADR